MDTNTTTQQKTNTNNNDFEKIKKMYGKIT